MARLGLAVFLASATGAAGIHHHQASFLQRDSGESSGCADLANHGTHFTIDVEVGTPPQKFAVVADTGSNSLIVPSCVCQQKGKCATSDRCFLGTNKSSTFLLETGEDQQPVSMVLSFGSGQIEAVLAKEQVLVGTVNVSMRDGLLLMTDRALSISGPFEGILGLGLPQQPTNWTAVEESEEHQASGTPQSVEEIIKKIMGQAGVGGSSGAVIEEQLPAPAHEAMSKKDGANETGGAAESPAQHIPEQVMREIMRAAMGQQQMGAVLKNSTVARGKRVRRDAPKGFLEQAGVGRFSMCFNDGANGVLRIGQPPLQNSHGGMGTSHWGLDFRGVSVGTEAKEAEVLFCSGENMTHGQASPCGVIPDSGTTVMMGAAEHLGTLLESICDSWPRCAKNYTKLVEAEEAASKAMMDNYGLNPFDMKVMSKADVLQLLLMDCGSWMTQEGGMDGMPDLHFHVRGSNGSKQALRIPASAYVMETSGEDAASALKLLSGVGNIPVDINATKGLSKVCSPAFGTMEYNTKENGPVWILGTPIFYEYVVGYDMNAQPPAISFVSQSKQACGSCGGTEVNLVARGARNPTDVAAGVAPPGPRRMAGPPRLPSVDTSLPL